MSEVLLAVLYAASIGPVWIWLRVREIRNPRTQFAPAGAFVWPALLTVVVLVELAVAAARPFEKAAQKIAKAYTPETPPSES